MTRAKAIQSLLMHARTLNIRVCEREREMGRILEQARELAGSGWVVIKRASLKI